MIFAEIAVGLLLIIVYAEAQTLSCSSTCQTDSTAEDNLINYTCQLEDSINRSVVLTWYHSDRNGWQESHGTPRQVRQGYTTRRDFSAKATAPSVAPLRCSVTGATVRDQSCQTEECDVLYSVRNLVTWPLLFASPDEKITCKADGNPKPTYEWEWKNEEAAEDDEWTTVPGETEDTIKAFLNKGTSIKLRCVAKNRISKEESPVVIVSKDGAATRTGIIVGVIVAVVILAIVAGVVYKFCFDD